jgi:hypothetical protein
VKRHPFVALPEALPVQRPHFLHAVLRVRLRVSTAALAFGALHEWGAKGSRRAKEGRRAP